MKNMYQTPIRYTNFAGKERNTTLYFHLTPRELADWMVDNLDEALRFKAGLEEMDVDAAEGDATIKQKTTMLMLVRTLAEISNGTPSEDGEYFDKSEIKKFIHSAAYDAFRVFLFEKPKELKQFVETLMDEQATREFAKALDAAVENQQKDEGVSIAVTPRNDGPIDIEKMRELVAQHDRA